MPPHSPCDRPNSDRISPAKMEMKNVCPKLLIKVSSTPADSQGALERRNARIDMPFGGTDRPERKGHSVEGQRPYDGRGFSITRKVIMPMGGSDLCSVTDRSSRMT